MMHSGISIGTPLFPRNFEGKTSALPVSNQPANSPMYAGLTERSVFHEPWWLDITTGGHWELAVVKNGDEIIAEMPYAHQRKGIWQISTQPPLTRTLGPVIKPAKTPSDQEWRRRIGIASELIAQLPPCALIQQTLDRRIAEAVAFALQGFTVTTAFTLQIEPGLTEESVWKDMRANTRNLIRRAAEQLTANELTNVDEFVNFYDANLAQRKRANVYGSGLMRNLIAEIVKRKAGVVIGAYDRDGSLAAAIVLVWDNTTMYYLLSTRKEQAHNGAIGMLLWIAIRLARERNLVFDFDGIPNLQIMTFLSGFGGTPAQRLIVEKVRGDYAAVRYLTHAARRYTGRES
jgi:hypothetical protein